VNANHAAFVSAVEAAGHSIVVNPTSTSFADYTAALSAITSDPAASVAYANSASQVTMSAADYTSTAGYATALETAGHSLVVNAASTSWSDYEAAVTAVGDDANATVSFVEATNGQSVTLNESLYASGYATYVSALESAGYGVTVNVTDTAYVAPASPAVSGNVTFALADGVTSIDLSALTDTQGVTVDTSADSQPVTITLAAGHTTSNTLNVDANLPTLATDVVENFATGLGGDNVFFSTSHISGSSVILTDPNYNFKATVGTNHMVSFTTADGATALTVGSNLTLDNAIAYAAETIGIYGSGFYAGFTYNGDTYVVGDNSNGQAHTVKLVGVVATAFDDAGHVVATA
jgi:hypothetical protein